MRRRRDPLTRTPARTFISVAEEETTNHSGGHVPFLSPLIKAATRHRVEVVEEENGCLATLTPLTLKKGEKVAAFRERRVKKKKEQEDLVKGAQPRDSTRGKAD